MEVIVGSRGSGRTTSCIKRASEIGGIVVVATRTRKKYTEQLAEDLNCDVKIVTVDELFTERGRNDLFSYHELCIDDSDTLNHMIFMCFRSFGFETDTITLCSDEDNIVELD